MLYLSTTRRRNKAPIANHAAPHGLRPCAPTENRANLWPHRAQRAAALRSREAYERRRACVLEAARERARASEGCKILAGL